MIGNFSHQNILEKKASSGEIVSISFSKEKNIMVQVHSLLKKQSIPIENLPKELRKIEDVKVLQAYLSSSSIQLVKVGDCYKTLHIYHPLKGGGRLKELCDKCCKCFKKNGAPQRRPQPVTYIPIPENPSCVPAEESRLNETELILITPTPHASPEKGALGKQDSAIISCVLELKEEYQGEQRETRIDEAVCALTREYNLREELQEHRVEICFEHIFEALMSIVKTQLRPNVQERNCTIARITRKVFLLRLFYDNVMERENKTEYLRKVNEAENKLKKQEKPSKNYSTREKKFYPQSRFLFELSYLKALFEFQESYRDLTNTSKSILKKGIDIFLSWRFEDPFEFARGIAQGVYSVADLGGRWLQGRMSKSLAGRLIKIERIATGNQEHKIYDLKDLLWGAFDRDWEEPFLILQYMADWLIANETIDCEEDIFRGTPSEPGWEKIIEGSNFQNNRNNRFRLREQFLWQLFRLARQAKREPTRNWAKDLFTRCYTREKNPLVQATIKYFPESERYENILKECWENRKQYYEELFEKKVQGLRGKLDEVDNLSKDKRIELEMRIQNACELAHNVDSKHVSAIEEIQREILNKLDQIKSGIDRIESKIDRLVTLNPPPPPMSWSLRETGEYFEEFSATSQAREDIRGKLEQYREVYVVGESGIGKSTLVAALQEEYKKQGYTHLFWFDAKNDIDKEMSKYGRLLTQNGRDYFGDQKDEEAIYRNNVQKVMEDQRVSWLAIYDHLDHLDKDEYRKFRSDIPENQKSIKIFISKSNFFESDSRTVHLGRLERDESEYLLKKIVAEQLRERGGMQEHVEGVITQIVQRGIPQVPQLLKMAAATIAHACKYGDEHDLPSRWENTMKPLSKVNEWVEFLWSSIKTEIERELGSEILNLFDFLSFSQLGGRRVRFFRYFCKKIGKDHLEVLPVLEKNFAVKKINEEWQIHDLIQTQIRREMQGTSREREAKENILRFFFPLYLEDNVKNDYIRESLDSYIPPLNGKGEELEEAAESFLKNKKRSVLLIQGDSGSGKTIFSHYFEERQIEYYNDSTNQKEEHLALRINLNGIQNLDSIVEDHLYYLGVRSEMIDYMKEHQRVLLILDGYDEVSQSLVAENPFWRIYERNRLDQWKQAKVIVSCRSPHINRLYTPERLNRTFGRECHSFSFSSPTSLQEFLIDLQEILSGSKEMLSHAPNSLKRWYQLYDKVHTKKLATRDLERYSSNQVAEYEKAISYVSRNMHEDMRGSSVKKADEPRKFWHVREDQKMEERRILTLQNERREEVRLVYDSEERNIFWDGWHVEKPEMIQVSPNFFSYMHGSDQGGPKPYPSKKLQDQKKSLQISLSRKEIQLLLLLSIDPDSRDLFPYAKLEVVRQLKQGQESMVPVRVFSIAPLSDNQIREYLTNKLSSTGIDYSEEWATYVKIAEGNPLFLRILVDHWDQIRREEQVTRDNLYRIFIEGWIERQYKKIRNDPKIQEKLPLVLQEEGLKKEILHHSQFLAYTMAQNDLQVVTYPKGTEEDGKWEKFFGDDPKLSIMRQGAPLRVENGNQYSFIHPEIQDYLGRCYLKRVEQINRQELYKRIGGLEFDYRDEVMRLSSQYNLRDLDELYEDLSILLTSEDIENEEALLLRKMQAILETKDHLKNAEGDRSPILLEIEKTLFNEQVLLLEGKPPFTLKNVKRIDINVNREECGLAVIEHLRSGIQIRSQQDGTIKKVLGRHLVPMSAVKWLEEGLVAGGSDGKLYFWNGHSETNLELVPIGMKESFHKFAITSIEITKEGYFLTYCETDLSLLIWKDQGESISKSILQPIFLNSDLKVDHLAFNSFFNEKYVFYIASAKLYILRVHDGKQKVQRISKNFRIDGMTIHEDNKVLIYGCDRENQINIQEYDHNTQQIQSLPLFQDFQCTKISALYSLENPFPALLLITGEGKVYHSQSSCKIESSKNIFQATYADDQLFTLNHLPSGNTLRSFEIKPSTSLQEIVDLKKRVYESFIESIERVDSISRRNCMEILHRDDRLWEQIQQDEHYKIVNELDGKYFGPKEWESLFPGIRLPSSSSISLPSELKEYLKVPCPFSKGRLVRETHFLYFIPDSYININSEQKLNLTLYSFYNEFLKSLQRKYPHSLIPRYKEKFEDNRKNERSWAEREERNLWALLYVGDENEEQCGLVPNSTNKTWEEQKILLQNYLGYEIPNAKEIIIGTFLYSFARNSYILKNHQSYTRCEDHWSEDGRGSGNRVHVGFFSEGGLLASSMVDAAFPTTGIAALYKCPF